LDNEAAFFLGFFVAIGAFNALLFAVARDAPFGWYAAAMFALAGVTLENGAPSGRVPDANLSAAFVFSLYYITLTGFCRAFLPLRRARQTFDLLTFPVLAALVAVTFIERVTHVRAAPGGGLDATLQGALLVLLFLQGVAALREGIRQARFYLVAFVFIALGTVINDLNVHGLFLPWVNLSNAADVGLGLQGLLFALALADRNRALTALGAIDGLTGIPNRRGFDVALRAAWDRARRAHVPLGVLMIDVDHFKRYNDGQGHQAGDDVLRRIARAISEAALRPDDVAARYGGEEFAVVLPLADSEAALAIGERVRHGVRALALPYPAVVAGIVTVSVGVASQEPQRGQESSGLLAAADRALYRAKSEGRDRVVLDSTPASQVR
jgi:diguanylate cyclase (GGDEF)-like protein